MKTNAKTTEKIQRSLHENMHGSVLTDFLAIMALSLIFHALVIGMFIVIFGR